MNIEQALALLQSTNCIYARLHQGYACLGRAQKSRKHVHSVGPTYLREPLLYCHERNGTPESDERRGRPLVSFIQVLARRSRLVTVAVKPFPIKFRLKREKAE